MFCGYCSTDAEKDNEIVIRDPFSSDIGHKVNRANKNQVMSMMDKVITYHAIIPSKFQEEIRKCYEKKILFTDKEFPPNNQSLNYTVANRRITWKRIPQAIPNAILSDGKIDATCIQQGNVGDCYFLACISSIAEVPQRINKIFCNDMQIRPEGIYRLQVACQGEYKQIIIDDFIPVFEGTNRPVFCKPHGNQVWVMLLEKAWAKLSGSYGNIEAGYPHEVLNTFLVSPCFYYEISSTLIKQTFEKVFLWNNLKSATQHRRPICAGSRQAHTCKGIKPAHTYSILGAYQVQTKNQLVHLLKLRNPWGDTQYIGKYSEYDEGFWANVSPVNKLAIFKKENENDGIFTIEFNQFLLNFECLDISHEQFDYNYLFKKVPAKSREPVFFQIEIQKTQIQEFYVTMQKAFDRNSYIKNRQVQYGYSKLLIAKKNITYLDGNPVQTFQYINSLLQTNFPDATIINESLNPGRYIVMAQTEFPNKDQGQFTISLYSKSVMNIERIAYPDPYFLQKVFTNHAHQKAPLETRVILTDSQQDWTVSQFLLKEGGFGYICVCLGPRSQEKVKITCNLRKIYESGFFVLEQNIKTLDEPLEVEVNAYQQTLIVLGIDFKRNFRQVTFPPKGIKISRII